jgi:hypothetical protein
LTRTVRLLDETEYLAEAEAGAFSYCLGGEERLERLCNDVRGHPLPGVADRQHDKLPGANFDVPGGIGLVETGIGRLDGQLAAVRYGVAAIDGKIDDRVFELAGIGVGSPQPAREHGFDGDVVAERAAEHFGPRGNQLVGVDRLRRQRLLPGEGEQAMGQGRCAFGAVERAVDETRIVGFAAAQPALQ